MGAVAFRAWSLARRTLPATFAIVLLGGITGGIVLGAWSSARRGSSSFDRFVTYGSPPNTIAYFCAPDVTADEFGKNQDCAPYDPRPEAEAIGRLPGVDAVSRTALVFGTYNVHGKAVPGPVSVALDERDMPTAQGTPVLVAGRLADPNVAEEVVVGEEAARLYHLGVGDVVGFTPFPPDSPATDGDVTVESASLAIVGIVRTPGDLAAGVEPGAAAFSDSVPFGGPAFWTRYGSKSRNTGVVVAARVTGRSLRSFEAALRARFPGRPFDLDTNDDPHVSTVSDAIGYETSAVAAVAVTGAAAWVVFVGQALLRRSNDEHADANTLRAVGMTRSQLVAAAAVRAFPVGVATALVATLVAVAASLETPTGLAARAEIDPGLHLDATVLVVGSIAIAVLTVAGLCSAPLFRRAGIERSTRTARRRFVHLRSVVADTGLSLASAPRRHRLPLRLAIAATALAVACAIAGSTLAGSLRHLVAHPVGYGFAWDAVVTGESDPFLATEDADRAVRAVRNSPDVSAASGAVFRGEKVGRENVTLIGLWSIKGPNRLRSVITSGREPRDTTEVAVGAKTMRHLGLGIGDHLEFGSPGTVTTGLEIVGEVLFYDGFQVEPGEGALADARFFGSEDARVPDEIMVQRAGPRPSWRSIERAGFSVETPPPPAGVRNLRRVDGAPRAVALVVGFLALAALAHAMATVVRVERKQLAVLRAIGFTRRQLLTALATTALALAGSGLLLGIPLGLLGESWSWTALERQVGFSSAVVVDWGSGAVLVLGVLIAALIGLGAGWFAARRSVTEALRAE